MKLGTAIKMSTRPQWEDFFFLLGADWFPLYRSAVESFIWWGVRDLALIVAARDPGDRQSCLVRSLWVADFTCMYTSPGAMNARYMLYRGLEKGQKNKNDRGRTKTETYLTA
jgi:hypothetical protein